MPLTETQIVQSINAAIAHHEVLEHLVLTIFDEMPNKRQITSKFAATIRLMHKKNIADGKAKSYLLASRQYQKILLEVLSHGAQKTMP